jgi:hypothetical protein
MGCETTLSEWLKHRPIFNPNDLWCIYSQSILHKFGWGSRTRTCKWASNSRLLYH